MGGCFFLFLFPVLVAVGFVCAVAFFALPIYAAFAAVMAVITAIAFAVMKQKGVFELADSEVAWQRVAVSVGKWMLILTFVFFVLSGLGAFAIWRFVI